MKTAHATSLLGSKRKRVSDDLILPIDPSISTLSSISSCRTVHAPHPQNDALRVRAPQTFGVQAASTKVCKTLTWWRSSEEFPLPHQSESPSSRTANQSRRTLRVLQRAAALRGQRAPRLSAQSRRFITAASRSMQQVVAAPAQSVQQLVAVPAQSVQQLVAVPAWTAQQHD